MLRRQSRLRREYIYRKSGESKERATADRRDRLKKAIDQNRPIPTDLREDAVELERKAEWEDEGGEGVSSHVDDEYKWAGVSDPKIIITTARDPSSKLKQFAKEMKLMFPNAQRINRGRYEIGQLIAAARANEVTDFVLVHEHRGVPDTLIVSHLPFGPTAYFTLCNVVMRHDIPNPGTVSEAYPHLVFNNFSSKVTDFVLVHEHRGVPDTLIVSHLPFGPTAYFTLCNVVMRHDIPNPGTVSEAYPHLVFNNFSSKVTDFVLVHEHRGVPDTLIVSHLPFGPTAYFTLCNVVMRHDIPNPGTVSEAYPHLVFNNFSSKVTDFVLVHEHRGVPDTLIVSHLPFGPTAYFTLCNVVMRHDIPNPGTVSEAYPHLVFNNFSSKVTDFVLVHEHRGVPDTLIVSHLPFGPTAYFTLCNVVMRHDIPNPGTVSEAYPHLVFNNFSSKVTDFVLVHEHRGVPDTLIVSHLPFGPTAYFTLCNVVMRHDIPNPGTVSEAYPHLVFNNFSSKVTDFVLVHEHRGVPDTLIVSHLPFGPTAYFTLCNVVMRHDIPNPGTVSEAYPHLVFNNFSSKLGLRVKNILKYLYPVPKEDSKRVITFSNDADYISFRHHTFKKVDGTEMELNEVGPRFELKLFCIKLGTVENIEAAETEWVYRPYMNTAHKRQFLAVEPEEDED